MAELARDSRRMVARAEFDAMVRRIDAIEAKLRDIESYHARRGPFNSVDVGLLVAIATATVTMTHFFTADVFVLSSTLSSLADALSDADIESASALAAWCKRIADCPIDGLVLRRHGRRVGRGQPWRIHAVVGVDDQHCVTEG